MSLQTRNVVTNSENAMGGLRGKAVVSNTFGLKRSALGEIGNKVVQRGNSVQLGKPGLLGLKPRTNSVTDLKSATSNVTKAAPFAKPAPRVPPATRVKRTDGTSSVSSALPPSRLESVNSSETAYSTRIIGQHVFDYDKEDEHNPVLLGYYVADIYRYLYKLEEKFPIQENFLLGQEVTARMRATLVDWLIEVQQQYHLLQETLYLAIQILDRYLQADRTTSRKCLQLVGVTAMYIACKYEEIYSPDVADFVYITDKAYTKQQLLVMEKQVAKTLNFEFSRPISLAFLRRFSKVAEVSPLHHNFSKYFLELALMEYTFCHVKPSLVAASALYVALRIYPQHSELWDAKLVYYSSYKAEEVLPVAQKLAAVITKAATSKFEAVRKKYSSSKLMKVSLRPELDSKALAELAVQS